MSPADTTPASPMLRMQAKMNMVQYTDANNFTQPPSPAGTRCPTRRIFYSKAALTLSTGPWSVPFPRIRYPRIRVYGSSSEAPAFFNLYK